MSLVGGVKRRTNDHPLPSKPQALAYLTDSRFYLVAEIYWYDKLAWFERYMKGFLQKKIE
jgi:hypothetical protein